MASSDWLLSHKFWLERQEGFGIVKYLDENGLIRQIARILQKYAIVATHLLELAKSIRLGKDFAEKLRQALDLFKQIFYNRSPYRSDGSNRDTVDYWEDLANASANLIDLEPENDDFCTLGIITIIRFVHCSLSNLILHSK